uniref:Sm domain-containing protein n=1 Tax=Electrophorus electricus TaxID=8005 RepID=A0A4W4H8Z8_ELEEL
MASQSVRERTIAENSLVILLQGLHGDVTTVELRDESTARGRVVNVDAFMNVRLEDVLYRDRLGRLSRMTHHVHLVGKGGRTLPTFGTNWRLFIWVFLVGFLFFCFIL